MSSDPNKVASVRQQQWAVEGWDDFFATKTGGEVTAETAMAYDGGKREPEVLGGSPMTSNLVLTRPYRPGLHADLMRQAEEGAGSLRTTISCFDTDPDLGPWGEPIVYADALLVRAKRPDYDASSGDPGVLELEFAVPRSA